MRLVWILLGILLVPKLLAYLAANAYGAIVRTIKVARSLNSPN